MSRASSSAPDPLTLLVGHSRPRLVDFFLILLGSSVSMLLAEMSGWKAVMEGKDGSAGRQVFLNVLPGLLFLSVGIVLLWPVFYGVQRFLGRQQPLAGGEWLWGLAWLGAVFLSAWTTWKGLGKPPEFLISPAFQKGVIVVYVVVSVSLAVVALVVGVVHLVGRWAQPWTHTFSLILMIWPMVPLAALWLWNIKLE